MYRVVTKKIERVTNRWMNDDTAGVKIPESLIFIKICIHKKIVNISTSKCLQSIFSEYLHIEFSCPHSDSEA